MAKQIELTSSQQEASSILSIIPTIHKLAAEAILEKINLNADGRVMYPDGQIGEHVLDHLQYHFKLEGCKRPLDSSQFKSLISINTLPNSGTTKWLKW